MLLTWSLKLEAKDFRWEKPNYIYTVTCDHHIFNIIRALPDNYNTFVSSLLLKDNLDKAAVQMAFVREDNQRRCHLEESPAVGGALAASSTSSATCDFCGYTGHTVGYKTAPIFA